MRMNSSPLIAIAFGLTAICASPAGASAFSATANASAAANCVGLVVQQVTNPTAASASAEISGSYGDQGGGCLGSPNDGALEFASGMSAANLATGVLQASAAGDSAAIPLSGGGNGQASFTDTLTIIPTGAGILLPGMGILTLTLDDSSLSFFDENANGGDSIQATIYASQNGTNLPNVVGTCSVSDSNPVTEDCPLVLQMDISH